jgi:hypothetical protein
VSVTVLDADVRARMTASFGVGSSRPPLVGRLTFGQKGKPSGFQHRQATGMAAQVR